MKTRERSLHVFARGALLCVGLFLVMFCVASPKSAQALTPAKAPDVSMKGATYVGMETCVGCHEDQGRKFKLSPHARIVTKGVENEAQACEICHGPGSIHAENGGGKGNAIINPKKDPTICFTCHMNKKMEFRLPYHHPVLEGKMSCTDCHELHGPDAVTSSTSMDDLNETCFKCHKDQQGPFVFEHPAMKDGCTTCHKVHGAITDKMLVARDANLCIRCHSDVLYPTKIGAAGNHKTNIQGGTCWSGTCHIAPHGSNFHAELRY